MGDSWVRLCDFVVAQGDLLKKDYHLARQVAKGLAAAAGVPLRRPGGETAGMRAA